MDIKLSLQLYKTVDICRTSRDLFTQMEASTLSVKAYLLGAYGNSTLRVILSATLTYQDSSILPSSCEAYALSTVQLLRLCDKQPTRFSSLKNNNISYEKFKTTEALQCSVHMQMCASLTLSYCLVFHAVSAIFRPCNGGQYKTGKQEQQPSCTLNKSIGSLLLPRMSTDY